jgi:hypothetical protein
VEEERLDGGQDRIGGGARLHQHASELHRHRGEEPRLDVQVDGAPVMVAVRLSESGEMWERRLYMSMTSSMHMRQRE